MLRKPFVLAALLLALAACGGPLSEPARLTITNVTPEDGATVVAGSVDVTARFDQPLDTASLAGNFTLLRNGEPVAGSVIHTASSRLARFTPEEAFAVGQYVAELRAGIRSEGGARLATAMSWSFEVIADDGNGNGGDDGDNGTPPPGNTDERALTFERPLRGTNLAGTVPIRVEASDPDSITSVTLYAVLGAVETSEPAPPETSDAARSAVSDPAQRIGSLTRLDDIFVTTWDTTEWPAGAYSLIAVANTDAVAVVEVSVTVQGPTPAFLTPTPDKRTAGLVDVAIELDAPRGIRKADLSLVGAGGPQRITRLVLDPYDDRRTSETLTSQFSTLDHEHGIYFLRVELEDAFGNTTDQELAIELLTPFVITTPTSGESVGGPRRIVAVTIGVNGTILDDYDITTAELYINGRRYAEDIPVDDDATSTRLIVYPWDTFVAGPGHDVEVTGDRMLTARVTVVDPTTGTTRTEFTPGVLVTFTGGTESEPGVD